MPQFGPVSLSRLATCHPDLQRLAGAVIQLVDIVVLCGHREQAAQDAAYETGASKLRWPQSAHNTLPSNAVDMARYPLLWTDTASFVSLAAIVKSTANQLGIAIIWGGDWSTFKDLDHYQLKTP